MLAKLVREATEALEGYEYTRALERTEGFFWFFCDNYLELVKARRYGDHGEAAAGSANRAMLLALSVLQRLFAPFLPFVTEEVWSWWKEGSVHRAAWPRQDEVLDAIGGEDVAAAEALEFGSQVLSGVRKKKSEERKPLRTPVIGATIRAPQRQLDLLETVWSDVRASAFFTVRPAKVPADSFEATFDLGEPESEKDSRA